MPEPPAKGRFLVAAPALEDPNFHRTVVFLLAADMDGALGVVLNRPSDTSVDDVVPHWGLHVSIPDVLFVGGPVQPNAAICVGQAVADSDSKGRPPVLEPTADLVGEDDDELGDIAGTGYSPLVGALGTVDLNRGPEDIDVSFSGMRVFTGYSGWGPGQLEEEIEAGAWFVIEGEEADVLSPEPDRLWERILRRQGGWMAVLARHPVDSSLN